MSSNNDTDQQRGKFPPQKGDVTFNNEGKVTGNFGNTFFENSYQVINALEDADDSQKDELNKLFNQLQEELNKAPASNQKQAEGVAEAASKLAFAISDKSEDKDVVEFHVNKLQQTAENIKSVLPAVFEIAGNIGTFALGFIYSTRSGIADIG